jgi:hypothetical protein
LVNTLLAGQTPTRNSPFSAREEALAATKAPLGAIGKRIAPLMIFPVPVLVAAGVTRRHENDIRRKMADYIVEFLS